MVWNFFSFFHPFFLLTPDWLADLHLEDVPWPLALLGSPEWLQRLWSRCRRHQRHCLGSMSPVPRHLAGEQEGNLPGGEMCRLHLVTLGDWHRGVGGIRLPHKAEPVPRVQRATVGRRRGRGLDQ